VLAEGDDRGIARAIFRSPLGAAWKSVAAGRADDDDDSELSFVDRIAAAAMKDTLGRSMGDDGRVLGAMARASLGAKAPITIATDMNALRTCNVIVSATNAPHPVITAEHLGDGPVVVCDVAAPGDVHPDVAHQRKNVAVLKGGMVRLPLGQPLRIRGMPIAPGITFGCLGETILMGLSGIEESLSVGALTAAGVRRARDLALLHGFGFDEKPFA
jgi:predicted amino acid dehydrogenase